MNEHKSRFKAYLISHESLRLESQAMVDSLCALQNRKTQLSASEFVFLFVALFLEARAPGSWWRKCQRPPGDAWSLPAHNFADVDLLMDVFKKLKVNNCYEFYQNYDFIKLPAAVLRCLARWSTQNYNLTFVEQPPTPLEMLAYQAKGERVVTLSLTSALEGKLVDGHRDAFEFLLHDLIHADLFFGSEHLDQVYFFNQIQSLLAQDTPVSRLIQNARLTDAVFCKDFDYLISDMNSHIAHMMALLRSALVKHQLYCEDKKSDEELSSQGRQQFELCWAEIETFFMSGRPNATVSTSHQALL